MVFRVSLMGSTTGIRVYVLLLIYLMANGCGAASQKELPWAPYNNSMVLEKFVMKPTANAEEVHLYIPKAYLSRITNPYGSRKELLSIETGLPDLEPRKAEFSIPLNLSEDMESVYQEKWKNGITIDISNMILQDIFWANLEARLKREFQLKSDDAYGLVFYLQTKQGDDCFSKSTPTQELAGKCFPRVKEHYLNKVTDVENSVYINCEREELKYTRCLAEVNIAGLKVIYSFRRTELYRWKEFDSGVRRLINSFINNI